MKAILKNYRQSPRKVRLVARAVVGKPAANAALILSFMPKRAADPIKKLIDSAVANARVNSGIAIEDLVVKSIEINKGVTLKRMRPRARGSGYPINKRTSHVVVTLSSKKALPAKEAATMDVSKPETKKKAPAKTAVEKVAKKKKVAKKAE
jgi:large subunit ribosomal protein L22